MAYTEPVSRIALHKKHKSKPREQQKSFVSSDRNANVVDTARARICTNEANIKHQEHAIGITAYMG